MKVPRRLQPLIEYGLIDKVISRLTSGKEADIFVVQCGNEKRCAKVYKERADRSFKKSVLYQEGRKVRNSRRSRALNKGSKFGREEQENIWQTTEVNALHRLAAADVCVPTPYICTDGVLLMELVIDSDGSVAPRLCDIHLSKEQALIDYKIILRYLIRMLCTGLVHGDLSEFNILYGSKGPVIIDLPQVVDAAANNNAQMMFMRDIENMNRFYGFYATELLHNNYGQEIWTLYKKGTLHPDTKLQNTQEPEKRSNNINQVLKDIKTVIAEHEEQEQEKQQKKF